MEKIDAQEWELLPKEEGYIEIHDDGGNKNSTSTPPTSFMSYFIQPQSLKTRVHPEIPPDVSEPTSPKLQQQKEAADLSTQMSITDEDDHVSQALFTQVVDIKVDSPRSSSSRAFHFGEKETKRNNHLQSSDGDSFKIWIWSLVGVAAVAGFCIIFSRSNGNKNQKRLHQQRE